MGPQRTRQRGLEDVPLSKTNMETLKLRKPLTDVRGSVIVFVGQTVLLSALLCQAQTPNQYDLLLQGGQVIDAKNKLNAVRDIAIQDGKVAAVEQHIDPGK